MKNKLFGVLALVVCGLAVAAPKLRAIPHQSSETFEPTSTVTLLGPFVIGTTNTPVAGQKALSSGSPSTTTVTVNSGARCVCTNATTQANPVKCAVSSTTLTITGPNTVTDTVTYFCF